MEVRLTENLPAGVLAGVTYTATERTLFLQAGCFTLEMLLGLAEALQHC